VVGVVRRDDFVGTGFACKNFEHAHDTIGRADGGIPEYMCEVRAAW
jgi:hypothetical protein